MELIITDKERPFLITPLDHRDVVKCRPANYLYQSVHDRIMADKPAIHAFLKKIAPFCLHPNLEKIQQQYTAPGVPYWQNGYFSGGDARAAYGIVAAHNPAKIIEIGSGNSTMFMRQAIKDFSLISKITSIDPAPRAEIDQLCDHVIRKSLLDVELPLFETLQPGDILFHDGSHLTFNGTDTVKLFLEILPQIKPGVIIHIHDISLPREYTHSFDNRGYSEQYMLATALLNSRQLEVILPIAMLAEQKLFPGGLSFWFTKKA